MKTAIRKYGLPAALVLLLELVPLAPRSVRGQFPPYAPPPGIPVPTDRNTQRNALAAVRNAVGQLQNATRTASNYRTGADALVWEQFQGLRHAFTGLTMTLTPQQQANGANEIAELSAGLDILQEAFANFQDDVAAGRPPRLALSDMCQVLYQASGVWLQQLNKDCARLRVGW
jgi:hypothetical protein